MSARNVSLANYSMDQTWSIIVRVRHLPKQIFALQCVHNSSKIEPIHMPCHVLCVHAIVIAICYKSVESLAIRAMWVYHKTTLSIETSAVSIWRRVGCMLLLLLFYPSAHSAPVNTPTRAHTNTHTHLHACYTRYTCTQRHRYVPLVCVPVLFTRVRVSIAKSTFASRRTAPPPTNAM